MGLFNFLWKKEKEKMKQEVSMESTDITEIYLNKARRVIEEMKSAKIDDLQRSNDILQMTVEKYKKDEQLLEQQFTEIKNENLSLTLKVKRFENESYNFNKLQNENTKLRQTLQSVSHDLSVQTEEFKKIEINHLMIDSLKKELNDVQQTNKNLNQQIKQHEETLTIQEAEIEIITSDLQQEIEALQDRNFSLQQQLKQTTTEKKDLSKLLLKQESAAAHQMIKTEHRLEEMTRKYAELHAEYSNNRALIQEEKTKLENELLNIQEERVQEQKTLKIVTSINDDLQSKLLTEQQEKQKILEQLIEAQEMIRTLKAMEQQNNEVEMVEKPTEEEKEELETAIEEESYLELVPVAVDELPEQQEQSLATEVTVAKLAEVLSAEELQQKLSLATEGQKEESQQEPIAEEIDNQVTEEQVIEDLQQVELIQEMEETLEEIEFTELEGQQQVDEVIKIFIDDSFETTDNKERRPKITFGRRDFEYESQRMDGVVQEAKAEYELLVPKGNRFAIRDRSEWQTDYATAYVNELLSERNERKRDELLIFMSKPYFARMDFITRSQMGSTVYITEASRSYGAGVISWKSEAASLFYLKTVGVPIAHNTLGNVEVDFIQEYSVSRGKIDYMYTPLTANNDEANDSYLVDKLNSNKGQSMESIVSTIQKEQYEMISLPIDRAIIIQGSAGSGKSAIALHRLSYLLYRYKNLSADKVVIIGPNETFLQYIKLVLPALGDYDVQKLTLQKLAQNILNIEIDPKTIAITPMIQYKGSLAFSAVVEKVTTDAMNQLKTWCDTLEIESMTVYAMPVLQRMDRSKGMANKSRLNEYYNIYLEQYKAQMNQENDWRKYKKEALEQIAKQIVLNEVKLPSLTLSYFIDESCTNSINELMKYDDSKDKVAQTILAKIRLKTTAFIRESLSNIHNAPQQLLEELLEEEWSYYRAREFEKQEDLQVKVYIKELNSCTTYKSFEEQFDFEATRQHLKQALEKQFEQEKTNFFLEKRETLMSLLLQNVRFYSEQFLSKNIEEAFRALFPKYGLNIKKKEQLGSLSEIELKDEVHHQIHKFVRKQIELDAVAMWSKLVKEDSRLAIVTFDKKMISKWDIPALLHVHRLLNGIESKNQIQYMIIDEAQDYMPYELNEMRQLTTKNGIMLIGDLGQNINELSTLENWHDYDELLNDPSHFELSATYRSTKPIVEFSNKIIAPFAKDRYNLATVAYREGVPVKFVTYRSELEESERLIETLDKYLINGHLEQVTIIVKDASVIEKYLDIIDPYYSNGVQTATNKVEDCKIILTTVGDAKGLEFGTVFLVDFDSYKDTFEDRKLAYVGASRALHELVVLNNEIEPSML